MSKKYYCDFCGFYSSKEGFKPEIQDDENNHYCECPVCKNRLILKHERKKLFICSYGQCRSPAAVSLFGGKFLEKGLGGASPKTIRRICNWADIIYVFEPTHVWRFKRDYPEYLDKLISLDIGDIYPNSEDPVLLEILEKRMKKCSK